MIENALERILSVIQKRIENDQKLANILKQRIEKIRQENCPHATPQTNDEGKKYCHDCNRFLE